jgi:hypothetical protein
MHVYRLYKLRDSSVSIALGYGLDNRDSGVRFPAAAGNFSLYHCFQNGSGSTQPYIQWVPGALSLGVKRPGREADHSPPSSAESKNEWSYTSTPYYASMEWCLKHRDNFTLLYLTLKSMYISCINRHLFCSLVLYSIREGRTIIVSRRDLTCSLVTDSFL